MTPDMNASELLSHIRHDLGDITDYIARVEQEKLARAKDPPGMLSHLGDYNYATYTEICHRNGVSPDFKIESTTVEEFKSALDGYRSDDPPDSIQFPGFVSGQSGTPVFSRLLQNSPLFPFIRVMGERGHVQKKIL